LEDLHVKCILCRNAHV